MITLFKKKKKKRDVWQKKDSMQWLFVRELRHVWRGPMDCASSSDWLAQQSRLGSETRGRF